MMSDSQQRFATTRWSIVQAAGDASTQTARVALEELCETYWPPVYAFLRRRGLSATDAEDMTQAFFVHLLDSEFVKTADADRGRFRSFLLKSVSHFVSDADRSEKAQKRGGNIKLRPLDFSTGEQQYLAEPVDSGTPEQLFERRWAMTLLAGTLTQIREEYGRRNQMLLFDSLEAHINQDTSRVPYADLAVTLNMTEDAIKQAARRLKLRYREVLRTEIANTVGSADDVDDELRQLMRALG